MRKTKDSGIEWIGKIPEIFDVVKVRFLCDVTTGNKDTVDRIDDGQYPFFVRSQHIEKINTFSFDGEAVLTAGDGDVGKIFHYIEGKFDFHQRVYMFSNFQDITGKYFYYYASSNFVYELGKYSAKTTVESLRLPWIKDFPIIVPSIPEQIRIANYLDQKVAFIENIIEKTKESIEEYKKLKQSIIIEAVTKGLNPNVRVKDTCIKWIGRVPENYIISKPFWVCEIVRGNSAFQKNDLNSEGDYVAIQYGKTYKVNEVDETFQFYVDKSFYKENQLVKNGDTILVSTSETMEDLGHSCFYNRKDYGLLGGEQIILRPNKSIFVDKFLYYATRYFRYEISQYATGLKVYRYNVEDLKKITIIIPPIYEQEEIVSYLDAKIPAIENMISKKESFINELESYKKSLIYEVVTGKKEIDEMEVN